MQAAISHDPPERKDQIAALESGGTFNKFDLLVIGGGATGAGIALDAVTRGLKVALVEKDDFSSGTSSKSTKLFHGGKFLCTFFHSWRFKKKKMFFSTFSPLDFLY